MHKLSIIISVITLTIIFIYSMFVISADNVCT